MLARQLESRIRDLRTSDGTEVGSLTPRMSSGTASSRRRPVDNPLPPYDVRPWTNTASAANVQRVATITGKEAEDFLEELQRQNREAEARALDEAKQAAAISGKEPFDLEALERLVDPSIETGQLPKDERRARLEELYYLVKPECMTLAELAQYIRDVNQW